VLAAPRLPAAAEATAALARRAGPAAVPVLLRVPAAAGRLRLARALHARSGRGGALIAATGRRPALAEIAPGATVYVDVGSLAPAAVLGLEALLDDGLVWVLAGLEPGTALPAPLGARLAAVVLAVPPLAERSAELDALAASVLATLAGRAGIAPPRLAPAAVARLAAHRWPGDLAELESVLAAAFVRGDGPVIEADDLVLAPPPAPAAPSATAHAAAAARSDSRGAELEFLLAELAHELRNPMVTIKTFSQHLPALMEDAELRERFEHLADDAIGRMDGLLENVLTFARLEAPRPAPVALGPVLERVVTEMEPELARRGVRIRAVGPADAQCAVDPEHLAYALRNLFAGVIREVPAGEELACDTTANGVVTLRFSAGGEAADRLRHLAAPGDVASLADPTLLPLAFRLARGVLERNGGGLAVVPEGRTATLVVRLPTAGGEDA